MCMKCDLLFFNIRQCVLDHPRIEPRTFLQPDIVNSFAKDFLFLGCIQYINQVNNFFKVFNKIKPFQFLTNLLISKGIKL